MVMAWVGTLAWIVVLLFWSTSMIGRQLPSIGLPPRCAVAPMQSEDRPDGFRWADMILRVGGQEVATEHELLAVYAAVPVGTVLRHEVIRAGQVETIAAVIKPLTWAAWWQVSWPLLTFGLVYALVGCLVGISGADQPQIRWLSLLCGSFAVAATNNAGYVPNALYLLSDCIANSMAGGSAIALSLVLSERQGKAWQAIIGSVVLGIVGWWTCPTVGPAFADPYVLLARWWTFWALLVLLPLACLLASVVLIARNVRRLPPGSLASLQNRLILAGAAAAFAPPAIVWFGSALSGAIPPFAQKLSLISFIAYPVTILAAVLRYRLFAIERIVRRLMVQAIALSSLLALFAWLSVLSLRWTENADPAMQWLTVPVLILLWDPARRGVEALAAHWFKPAGAGVTLLEERLQQALDRDSTEPCPWDDLLGGIAHAMRVSHAAIATRQGDGFVVRNGPAPWRAWPIAAAEFPTASRLVAYGDRTVPAGVTAVVPLVQGKRQLAILWLGPAVDGAADTVPDLALVAAVLHQITLPLATAVVRDGTRHLTTQMAALRQRLTAVEPTSPYLTTGIIDDMPDTLQRVLAEVDLLMDDPTGGLAEAQRSALGTLRDSADALMAHLASLQAWQQLEEGTWPCRPTPLDARPLLQQAIARHVAAARQKGITLHLHAPLLPRLQGDAACSLAVLDRLLENAVTHAPSASTILISAQVGTDDLTVRIVDEGPGIAPELQSRIWLPFGQTLSPRDREHGHIGMGLPLAKAWMELQGGTLRYEADPLAGSAFVCTWPLAAGSEATEPAAEPLA
jgi:signal transduction histidine kinase